MENLKRIREPLAWALIGLTALTLLLQFGLFWWNLVEAGGGIETAIGWLFAMPAADPALLLALVVAAVGCALRPAVPRARPVALAAATVATLAVVLPWALMFFGLVVWPAVSEVWAGDSDWWRTLLVLYPPARVGIGVLAAIALWVLGLRSAARTATGEVAADPAEPADEVAEPVGSEPAPAEHPTVWKPTEATGTVWRTADEAAAGAPGAPSLGASTASEWALEQPRREPAPSEDWRPPSTA
ncbi:MAG: hypothetical protein QM804_17035 [Propionicimonas sp.]